MDGTGKTYQIAATLENGGTLPEFSAYVVGNYDPATDQGGLILVPGVATDAKYLDTTPDPDVLAACVIGGNNITNDPIATSSDGGDGDYSCIPYDPTD